MEGNILKRDRQQFQTNEELDLRARLLMREAECIIQESTAEKVLSPSNLAADIAANIFIPKKQSSSSDTKFSAFATEKLLTSPPRSGLQSFEPELRFLRAKVKILTTEIDKQKEDQKKKSDEIKALDNELHLTKDERNKTLQQLASAETKIAKMTSALLEQGSSLKVLESLKGRLSNELQTAKKEATTSSQAASTMEVRMNRALEEVEGLRSTLQNRRGQEKGEHDAQRKMIENQCALIQRLERQQAELILAFRKQMMLCHNLQRQKELMSGTSALNLADFKFNELLGSKQGGGSTS